MSVSDQALMLGEHRRVLDERFRLSLPPQWARHFAAASPDGCMLAKERPGALSLWPRTHWGEKLAAGVRLVQSKIEAGRLSGRIVEVQRLGRLLSSRHQELRITERGRVLIPEGFRSFLDVAAGEPVMVVGAAVCIEIWQVDAWNTFLAEQMPEFHELFDRLTE